MIKINNELREHINNYNSKIILKAFVSNINVDTDKNLDTVLYGAVDSTQNNIFVVGDYGSFEGYVALNHEIMKVTDSNYVSSSDYTELTVKRGSHKTKPQSHYENNIVRSIELLRTSTSDTLDFSISKKSDVAENQLFQPILTNNTLTIYEEDVSKWVNYSGRNEYLVRPNKYIYIYVGYDDYCVRETTGYITDWYSSSKEMEVTINFTSKLNLWYDKSIDYIKVYKNLDMKSFFSELLDLPIEQIKYAKYNDSDDFSNIEYVTLKDYKTYGDLIVEVCKSKNIRIAFDALENLIISTTVKKQNINNWISSAENIDVGIRELTDIDTNTQDAMIFNNINCNFLKRKPLKNKKDFIVEGSDWILNEGVWNDLNYWRDEATWYDTYFEAISGIGKLKYIKEFNSGATSAIILSNDGSWQEFDFLVGTDVKYFQIGSQLILKDRDTELEFVVKVTNKNENTITCIGGFDKDKEIDYVGKIDYLISLGFNSIRDFIVYYNIIEMPYVWGLTIDESSDNLKIPILPNETITYSAKYGTPNLADIEFSGIVEENDNIFGTFTNLELKYNQDHAQQIPVYLQTNKLKIEGIDQEQIYKYSSFDNSNIELKISYDETGENDFNIGIKNTLNTGGVLIDTPLKTNRRLLEVSSISYFSVGDVLVLDESNLGKSYYNDLQNEKWTITSKFIDEDSGDNYIMLDKNYPTEEIGSTEPSQNYTFKRYYYSTIIHLNELRVRGNPVMQSVEPYNSKNETSIENYGMKTFEISGDIATIDDMKLLFNSLKNEYSGLDDDTTPLIVPFSTTHRFDFEVGDIVRLTDSVITKVNNRIAVIVSKDYNSSNALEFNYEAILISSYEPFAEDVNLTQVINYQPVKFATYDSIPNSDINSNQQESGNSIITIQSDNFGYITALRIDRTSYRGFTKNQNSDNTNNIEVTMEGELSAYNIPLLYQNKMCIMSINDEFILVKGTEEIDVTTSATTVNILERDLFDTGETQIGYNQEIVYYKILSIQSEDGNYFTDTLIGDKDLGYYMQWEDNKLKIQGEVQIGGDRGRIVFEDSKLVLDDYFDDYGGGLVSRGFILQDSEAIFGAKPLLYLNQIQNNGIGNEVFFNLVCEDSHTFQVELSKGGNVTMGAYSFIPNSKKAIQINDLKLTSSKTRVDDMTFPNGVLSYHDGHFWGYSDGWKQLDIEGGGSTAQERKVVSYGEELNLELEENKNVTLIFSNENTLIRLPALPDDRMEIKIIKTAPFGTMDVIPYSVSSLIYEERSPSGTTLKQISNRYECYSFINDGSNWYAMNINWSM